MADLDHNGIDDELEVAEYKKRSVSAKFVQQLSYGIGAAMVFGLVSAIAKGMLDSAFIAPAAQAVAGTTAAAGGFAMLPVLGLAALAVAGVGLLYLSAKYLSENTLRDQELQAKQISVATRGKAPTVEPIAQGHVQELPEIAEAKAPEAALAQVMPISSGAPQSIIGDRALGDTISPRDKTKEPAPGDQHDSWTAQVQATNDNEAQLSRAV